MNKLLVIVKKKPSLFVIVSFLYLLLAALLKWHGTPTWNTLWFMLGGVVGIYFMDIAEEIFAVTPSPFRTVLFAAAFTFVSFFVVTSSGSQFAIGLVLTLFLTMILWMYGELSLAGNLRRWYEMINATITPAIERWGMIILIILFLFETAVFIRN